MQCNKISKTNTKWILTLTLIAMTMISITDWKTKKTLKRIMEIDTDHEKYVNFSTITQSLLVPDSSNIKHTYKIVEIEHIPDEKDLPIQIKSVEPKKILLYGRIWSFVRYENGVGMFRNCRVTNCFITGDHKRYKWKNWDAIMWDNVFSNHKFTPPERYSHTKYILMNREGPARYGGLKKWPVTFNWTMTYRIDSEVPFRYGYMYRFTSPREYVLPHNKTGLAAWMCSDRNSKSGREQLKKSLQKYMHIDIYGTEGSLRCGKNCRARNGDLCDSKCRDMIGKKYKFFFAFEPSLCKDWSTEKLYTMLQRPIVPVTWSGANVSLLAPPHSTINALDFDTAKDLVDYLKYLDGNDTAYFEYFKWKRNYGIIAGTESLATSFCHLCARLHQDQDTYWYENLHEWWVKDQCIDPNSPRIRRYLNISDKVHLPYPKNGENTMF